MNKILALTLAFTANFMWAQSGTVNIFDFIESRGVKVIENGDSLMNAWAGGLNSVSVNNIDLNRDGIQDLVIFDAASKKVSTYLAQTISTGMGFIHTPEYQSSFPTPTSWMIIKDYDCDGKKDVFYNNQSKIYVLQNTSSGTSFSLTDPLNGPIKVQVNSGMTFLYASAGDKPAIVDIDDDGDLDFFSFSAGGSISQYNKNRQACGLDFILEESCWGHFSESGFYRKVNLDACTPYVKNGMHSGSSMLILDLNNDGLKDLLLGNITYPDITALYNAGSLDSTHFTSQDTLFPTYNKAITTINFAALSHVDLNHDSISDLIASPFAYGSGNEDHESVLFYENLGTETNPLFNHVSDNFMQNSMIDLGSGAVPRLVDLNADAKPDLVISNTEMYDTGATMGAHFYRYYRNTGGFFTPEFTLVDGDLANISSYGLGIGTIPAFGDLDGDGDQDMIVGDMNGTLHHFENSSQLAPSFTLKTAGLGGFDVGQDAAPYLFDMDDDGDLDLLVGNNRGRIYYYENSSASSPSFTLKNDFFGAVDTYTNLSSSGKAIPYVFKQDSTINMFVGSTSAGVIQLDSVASVVSKPSELVGTIGNGNLISSDFEETPFGISKRNGRNQFLIKASELKAMGFTYGYITKIGFDVTTGPNITIWQGVSIRCKLTQDTVLTDFQTGLTEVRNADLSGSLGLGMGWNDLDLSREVFLWDGKSNLIVDVCFGGQSSGSDIHVKMTDVGFNAHAIGNLIDNSLDRTLGCKQPYKMSITKRPNMRITITPALANTNVLLTGLEHTAPALHDFDFDGYPEMIVGNRAGGLSFFKGKIYDVSLPEERAISKSEVMEIYPNPGSGNFNVRVKDYGQMQLSVFDLTGKLILQRALTEPDTQINITNQSPGLYLFILNDGKTLHTQKVILQ